MTAPDGFPTCPDCGHVEHEHERPHGCSRCACEIGYWGDDAARTHAGRVEVLARYLAAECQQSPSDAQVRARELMAIVDVWISSGDDS